MKKPLVDLNEDEQWKIINETGVLHKLKEQQDQEPHVLVAILLTVPLIFCHAAFDYISHLQFGFENDFNMDHLIKVQLPAILPIFILCYVTNYFKKVAFGQFIFGIAASAIGILVVHYTVDDTRFAAIMKVPSLITIGILLIIQADLLYALVPIAVAVLYYYRDSFMKFLPLGSLPELGPEL